MGRTLIQAREEARQRYMRTMAMVAALPVLLAGVALLYFGYGEQDIVYLFLYFFVGFGLLLLGVQLLVSSFPSSSKITRSHRALEDIAGEAHAEANAVSSRQGSGTRCSNCGAEITSAGKFCGNCGKPIA